MTLDERPRSVLHLHLHLHLHGLCAYLTLLACSLFCTTTTTAGQSRGPAWVALLLHVANANASPTERPVLSGLHRISHSMLHLGATHAAHYISGPHSIHLIYLQYLAYLAYLAVRASHATKAAPSFLGATTISRSLAFFGASSSVRVPSLPPLVSMLRLPFASHVHSVTTHGRG